MISEGSSYGYEDPLETVKQQVFNMRITCYWKIAAQVSFLRDGEGPVQLFTQEQTLQTHSGLCI